MVQKWVEIFNESSFFQIKVVHIDMLIKISIPSYRKIEGDNDKSYTVFIIEVYAHGKRHVVERRYSEFESLHKRMKKNVRTPEFPPKKMMKLNHKVLEQRRMALEAYLQGILDRGSVPRSLLRFVEIEGESETTDTIDKVEDIGPTHQPVLAFSEDVFVLDQKDGMQDIISAGVLGGFYGSTDDIR